MQQFFQDLQGKLWNFLILQLDKATDLSNKFWNLIKPYLEISWGYVEKIFFNILEYVSLSISILNKILSTTLKYSLLIRPTFENIYRQNKYKAIGLLIFISVVTFFWFSMILHAKRNEVGWKKVWIFAMVIFGPIGAMAYFFLRKRRSEKQQDRKDKVMMKFFSPMHKD